MFRRKNEGDCGFYAYEDGMRELGRVKNIERRGEADGGKDVES